MVSFGPKFKKTKRPISPLARDGLRRLIAEHGSARVGQVAACGVNTLSDAVSGGRLTPGVASRIEATALRLLDHWPESVRKEN